MPLLRRIGCVATLLLALLSGGCSMSYATYTPYITPIPSPTVTAIAAPPAFSSGGIGLTREEIIARYGSLVDEQSWQSLFPEQSSVACVQSGQGNLAVSFQDARAASFVCTNLGDEAATSEIDRRGVSLAVARAIGRELLPADATLLAAEPTLRSKFPADRHRSATLEGLYPRHSWRTSPGQVSIRYDLEQVSQGGVITFVVHTVRVEVFVELAQPGTPPPGH